MYLIIDLGNKLDYLFILLKNSLGDSKFTFECRANICQGLEGDRNQIPGNQMFTVLQFFQQKIEEFC